MPTINKEKRREYINKWQRENRDKCKAAEDRYFVRFPEKKLLKSAKYNAKARGLDFEITVDDIIIPEYCPYLGIKLEAISGSPHKSNTMSIDRIDSSLGYIKGNVEVVSHLANMMKSYATQEQLITFAENVLKRFK